MLLFMCYIVKDFQKVETLNVDADLFNNLENSIVKFDRLEYMSKFYESIS